MFTGIIQALGTVASLEGPRLRIQGPHQDDWLAGESIAVNGCCLTLLFARTPLEFDLSEETLGRTNLKLLKPGDLVNLERAVRPTDRLGGHFVQGHVDAQGEVVAVDLLENSVLFSFRVPPEWSRYLIEKGSITIDGISLTIVEPLNHEFKVAVIPHTLANTNLSRRRAGDAVNVEIDLLAKYVERLVVR